MNRSSALLNSGRLLLASLSGLAVTSLATAQDLTHKAPAQKGPIAIVGGTVHPVTAEPIENGAVLFESGIIRGVYTAQAWSDLVKTALFKEPLTVIDAKGKHVWPGLISPYTALGLTEIQALRQTNDMTETGDITPEVIAANAVNPDSTLLPVTRSNGILTVGTFPNGGTFPGCASVIRLDGWTTQDMTVLAHAGQVLRWPTSRTFNTWWMDRSEEDQSRENNTALTRLKETMATARAYAVARAGDAAHPTDLRWEAMRRIWPDSVEQESSPGGAEKAADSRPGAGQLPVFIHAGDLDQINAAVSFAMEQGLKCVIVGGRDADRCAELLKKHDIPVIVSGGTFVMPRRGDSAYDDAYTLPARLHAAGIRFSVANGDDTAHERNVPYAVAMAVAHGLPHDAGIRALTIDAATILGVGDSLGSIETGKSATLIITTGSPLEVTTHVTGAFIDGRTIDLSNKQTKLYEKYRERYRQTGDLKVDPGSTGQ